jgi:co-chaperonin GroES (HSP10)
MKNEESELRRVIGYTRVERPHKKLNMLSDYVAIQEDLSRDESTRIILINKKNTTIGTVLGVGPGVEYCKVGDRVLFEEWQGGKWAFPDDDKSDGQLKCLIMREMYVECLLSTTE